jgi:hypothetical protein
MTRLNVRTLLSAGIAGSMLLAAAVSARADDSDRWERDRGRDRHHYVPEHRYHVVHERYVEVPQRVVYQRQPVVVMPAPVYQAPLYQAPVYSQPAEPSLNFNFTIPLR